MLVKDLTPKWSYGRKIHVLNTFYTWFEHVLDKFFGGKCMNPKDLHEKCVCIIGCQVIVTTAVSPLESRGLHVLDKYYIHIYMIYIDLEVKCGSESTSTFCNTHTHFWPNLNGMSSLAPKKVSKRCSKGVQKVSKTCLFLHLRFSGVNILTCCNY